MFHVRESAIEVEKRVAAAQCAFMYNDKARIADPKTYAKVIPIPLRPPWNNRMSKEAVQANETSRFEKYLEVIYNALPPARLNHFEHNLDVWRQLWRTCELSDILLLCVDARHPLFHFPPSLYDFIVKKMSKPLVVVFNKIDLVPFKVLAGWKTYFETVFPGVRVVFFTSYPLAETVTFETADVKVRRKQVLGLDGRNTSKKPQPVGVKELIDVVREMVAGGSSVSASVPEAQIQLAVKTAQKEKKDAEHARALASGKVVVDRDDDGNDDDDVEEEEEEEGDGSAKKETRLKTKPAVSSSTTKSAASVPGNKFSSLGDSEDDEDGGGDNAEKKNSGPSPTTSTPTSTSNAAGHTNADGDSQETEVEEEEEEEQDTNTLSSLQKSSSSTPSKKASKMTRKEAQIAASAAALSSLALAAPPPSAGRIFTIGMVGHPNAGKSSLINSILGRTAVSVSNTPGHTKHLQTIAVVTGASDLQLCDCPGLVFPAADMPRPLQVLMGIFPLASLREPYSCVQFLAERLPLVDIYELVPYLAADSDAALSGLSRPLTNFIESIRSERTKALNRQRALGNADDETQPDPVTATDIEGVFMTDLPQSLGVLGSENTATSGGKGSAGSGARGGSNGRQQGKKGGNTGGKRKGGRGGAGGDDDYEDADDLFHAINKELVLDAVTRRQQTTSTSSSLSTSSSSSLSSSTADSLTDQLRLAENKFVWSSIRICESFAVKKGWREEGGRPDVHKAGLHIVKDCLEGRLSLFFTPPPLPSTTSTQESS